MSRESRSGRTAPGTATTQNPTTSVVDPPPGLAARRADSTRFIHQLDQLGVPLFAANQNDAYDPGSNDLDVVFPRNWQQRKATANHRTLKLLSDMSMTKHAVTTGLLGVVDVDTKHGADIESTRQALTDAGVRIWAEVQTPSGGRHFYVVRTDDVPRLNLGKLDLPGVELLSKESNVFLPGSRRPKYPDTEYTVVFSHLDQLHELDDHEREALGARLAAFVTRHTKPRPQKTPNATQRAFAKVDATGGTAYGRAALQGNLDELRKAEEGTRNDTLNAKAYRAGRLIEGGQLDGEVARQQLLAAAEDIGLPRDKATATIESGTRAGSEKPFSPATGVIDEQSEDVEEVDGSSWAPVDLSSILDGTYTPIQPTLLPRTDGVCLLYRGLTHSFHGESESGKSLIAQAEAARVLNEGGRVLFVDFESDAGSVVERLLALGVQRTAVRDRFIYVQPETNLRTSRPDREVWNQVLIDKFDLAIVDGVTAALGVFGASTIDNDDITAWIRLLPDRIARRTGAATLVIDHVAKNAETRGRFAIGGQAKMAALTGAAYVVEVKEPLGRGLRGQLALRVAKDRPGYVRATAGPYRGSDRTQAVASITVDATGNKTIVTVGPESPDSRPTYLMERVSRFLEEEPDPAKRTANKIKKAVKGKSEYIGKALEVLVNERYVERQPGPRNSQIHTSHRRYREHEDREMAPSPHPTGTASGSPYREGNREPVDALVPGTTQEPEGTSHHQKVARPLAVTASPPEECGFCDNDLDEQAGSDCVHPHMHYEAVAS